MKVSRRKFLRTSGVASIGTAIPARMLYSLKEEREENSIAKEVDEIIRAWARTAEKRKFSGAAFGPQMANASRIVAAQLYAKYFLVEHGVLPTGKHRIQIPSGNPRLDAEWEGQSWLQGHTVDELFGFPGGDHVSVPILERPS